MRKIWFGAIALLFCSSPVLLMAETDHDEVVMEDDWDNAAAFEEANIDLDSSKAASKDASAIASLTHKLPQAAAAEKPLVSKHPIAKIEKEDHVVQNLDHSSNETAAHSHGTAPDLSKRCQNKIDSLWLKRDQLTDAKRTQFQQAIIEAQKACKNIQATAQAMEKVSEEISSYEHSIKSAENSF